MEFSFEVRESDLLGRIGSLTVGKKRLETPFLFPVIHPVDQAVPTADLAEMGFGGLMTNAYILYSRLRREVSEKGIHRMLGFDGVFMTDSGGYQVLNYGDLGVGYADIAAFETEIGSELAVTLDRPTGYSRSLAYAKDTVDYSLRNALATMKDFGRAKTTWVGPVQGGLFPSLLKRSARSLVAGGYEFLALGSPTQVMENYRFPELARMIVATRSAIPYSMPLHLFGAGHPLTMALAVGLGCDTFDSASYILFARKGRYMTERGVTRLELMKYLPCSCIVCAKTSVKDLIEMDHRERTRSLAVHNLYVLKKELDSAKEAITEGRLWDLVREKSVLHPRGAEAFAYVGKSVDGLRAGTPAIKNRGLFVRDETDLGRPEVVEAARRLRSTLRRNSKKALLLRTLDAPPVVCYPGAKAGTDVYRLHPALGPYPVELDFVYPFTQTVCSSSLEGGWSVKQASKALRGLGYDEVRLGTITPNGKVSGASSRNKPSRKAVSPSPPWTSARPQSLRRP